MEYRILGKTGWKVSTVGFGAWGIGGQWGVVSDDDAITAMEAALDAGVNFFDTADAYGEPSGRSEELVGRVLKRCRDKVFIASKVGNFARRFGYPLSFDSPMHVTLCCEATLHRLGADYLDLYQCHLGDCTKPDVFLEAFTDLKRRGKIRAFGISTDRADVLRAFDRNGDCASCQADYSLLNRKAEAELLPLCAERGVGVIVRGPLAKGLLTGKFTAHTVFGDSVRRGWNEGEGRAQYLARLEVANKLRVLDRESRPPGHVALQFVLAHPAVTTAIPGAKNRAQAAANARAGDKGLSANDLEQARQLTSEIKH